MDLEKAVQEYKRCGLVGYGLVHGLVEHFEMTRQFRILWSRDPMSSTEAFEPRIPFVECWFGGAVVKTYVSACEFPLGHEKRGRMEHQLKMRCLQEYAKGLSEVVTYSREPEVAGAEGDMAEEPDTSVHGIEDV